MEDAQHHVSRRRFVGFASALGAAPLFGLSPRAALVAQEGGGEAFPNGIDVTRQVGGDGLYQKYRDESIRLGLIEAFPVNFVDADGNRTGWSTDIVLRALEHSGIGALNTVKDTTRMALTPNPSPDARERGADRQHPAGHSSSASRSWRTCPGHEPLSRASTSGARLG
ncbi:MAG: hypothetical protein QM692_03235 [Thermomicrobiales bacterium]